ncbi:PilZ domain-containing protein [Mesoterricola sediminis]|uniref:Response regulatory domain-containing protein n=1 Tax=Mesoterricola sediminis TaxID=2927980 RepID=A0AA48KD87_9BACT|nr:PilZ domain-containing protein [Mesoterricola sediminis]BDU76057.1 hypothetical protein METESE_10150 [Mesoterricola sediminis]
MMQAGRPELRDARVIRAYLDEAVRLKLPVRLSRGEPDPLPFQTTLEHLGADTFTVTATPPLEPGQSVHLGFLLEGRWLTTAVQVLGTGIFSFPTFITHGERRAAPRGAFQEAEGVRVLAVEQVEDTVLGGRVLSGRVLDLSLQGLRLALDAGQRPRPGDRFALLCLDGLPHTPPVLCAGRVANVQGGEAGLALEALRPLDRLALERILARRMPASFGRAFPSRKLKTDVGERPGAPTPVKEAPRAPEVVQPLAPEPPGEPERAAEALRLPAVLRLRRMGRRILLLASEPADAHPLAQFLWQEGYRNILSAHDPAGVQRLAAAHRFDLVLVELKVGGYWGHGLLAGARNRGLLAEAPAILLADRENEISRDAARNAEALHLHLRPAPPEALLQAVDLVLSGA